MAFLFAVAHKAGLDSTGLSQVMDLQIHGLWHSGHTLAIACAMFLTSMANTIVNNRYMHRSMRLVMHLKVRTT